VIDDCLRGRGRGNSATSADAVRLLYDVMLLGPFGVVIGGLCAAYVFTLVP
jgi:hypothetical protein